jgi:hypothetical protein
MSYFLQKKKNREWMPLFIILILHTTMVVLPLLYVTHAADWVAEAHDSRDGHTLLINYFIAHPSYVLTYPSDLVSTVPGYHILMAKLAWIFGVKSVEENTWSLRLINTVPSNLFLIVMWFILWKMKPQPKLIFSLLLPIAFSYYLLASAIWINTDNLALLFYALLILIFLTNRSSVLGGITAFFLVFCRQVYLPVTAAFWPPAIFPKIKTQSLKFAVSVTVCASAIFLIYAWHWQGLTPVGTQNWNKFVGINYSSVLQAFSIAGLFAIPYSFLLFADIRYYQNKIAIMLSAAIIFSLLIWLMSPTNWSEPAGRVGSLIWRLDQIPFHYNQHAVIILLLNIFGVFVFLNLISHAFYFRYYPIETMMLLFYLVGYSTQIFAFQRYVEIPILITYAMFSARIKKEPRYALIGPIVLAGLFVMLSIAHIWWKL